MTTLDTTGNWEQIAQLKPRLRSHTGWQKIGFRGIDWYLLRDRASGRHYHFSESAYHLLQRLNGHTTLQTALAEQSAPAEPDAGMKQEAVALILRLQASDLLMLAGSSDSTRLYQQWRKQRAKIRLSLLMRPLAVRLPLLDPDRLLQRTLPLVRPLFHWSALLLWFGVMLVAGILALQHADRLAEHADTRLLDPSNLLLLWLCYPLVKALHELGHAYAIRHWGGKVHELGIMLLVFVPVPYVDASAATAFPQKWRRVLVGAAGIMVELLLAAAGVLVWLWVQPGLIRDLAFNVSVIGGLSALLFNGNPLLKFDGYYVLADLLEIPNLASRAQRYYAYLAQRYLLAVESAESPVVAQGERGWFIFYGAASYLYRLFIGMFIALYVAGKFFIIGTLLALWVILSQQLLPFYRIFRYLLTAQALKTHRQRAWAVTAVSLLGITLLLSIPLPSNTLAEGVIRIPQRAIVRAEAAGDVVELLRADGSQVAAGEPLIRLQDAALQSETRILTARKRELAARLEAARMKDRVAMVILQEQLEELDAEIADNRRQLDALLLLSPEQGELEILNPADLQGRFVQKGRVLGLIHNTEQPPSASIVIAQADAVRVRRDTRGISARYPGRPDSEQRVQLLADTPSGSYHLPSAALGTLGGGRIAIDARDPQGMTALEPIFQYEIELPEVSDPLPPGARIQVRFEHTPETLSSRWFRSLRQLLLARLGV